MHSFVIGHLHVCVHVCAYLDNYSGWKLSLQLDNEQLAIFFFSQERTHCENQATSVFLCVNERKRKGRGGCQSLLCLHAHTRCLYKDQDFVIPPSTHRFHSPLIVSLNRPSAITQVAKPLLFISPCVLSADAGRCMGYYGALPRCVGVQEACEGCSQGASSPLFCFY